MNKTISAGCGTTVNQLQKLLDGYKCSNFNFTIFVVSYLIRLKYMNVVTVM
jgi:hypothetical protein